VMHLAFTDISRAAFILGNPKTRKLYDRGYIDEFGKRTRTGRVRASRVRAAVLAGAFLSTGFAGLAIFSISSSNPPPESTSLLNPAPQRAAQAFPPVSQPRPPEETQKSASNEKSGSQGLKASLPLQADAREYLPPEARDAPENHQRQDSSESSPRLSLLPKSPAIQSAHGKPGERRTPNPERRRLARLSRTSPQMLQSYIWFGRPVPNSGPIRASQTLKTAHCLACLTDHEADCSRACP
jgi:hypothetical protein